MDLTGIGTAADAVKSVIGMFFPDKTEEEKAKLAATLQLITAQTDINKAQASQPGIHFRDGAGWTCVGGFALMLLRPVIEWGFTIAGHPITLPTIDTSQSNDMLIGLLGLGSMHVYQQVKGN